MGLPRSVFKHTIIYSAATILGRLASFIMLPFYAHIFQAEGYGVIGMIDTSLGIFTVLLTGGFQMAILRIYHEQEEPSKGLTLSTGIRLVWAIAVGLILIPLFLSMPLSRYVLGSDRYYPLICIALVTFVIDVTGQSASTHQIIQQQSILFSVIGFIRLFIGMGLNIWLVLILQVGLIGIFISSLISASVASIAFHFVALREHGFKYDKTIAKDLVRFQLPMLPGELVSFIGRQTERILVRILIGIEGMGVLEMAYRFPPLLNYLINIPFQRAWRTKSIEIAAQKDAPEIISQMFTRYLFMMVLPGTIMAVTIRNILELMTPPEFWPAARITQVEVLTTIITGCSGYLMFGLVYSKRTQTISMIRIVLTPIKIAIGVLMIWGLGLAGAAYSALIIEIAALVWLWNKAQAQYTIRLEWVKIAVMALMAAVLFILLDGNSYADFGPAQYIRERCFVPIIGFITTTSLAQWRSGKLIEIITAKQDIVLSAGINTVFSFALLVLLPMLGKRKNAV